MPVEFPTEPVADTRSSFNAFLGKEGYTPSEAEAPVAETPVAPVTPVTEKPAETTPVAEVPKDDIFETPKPAETPKPSDADFEESLKQETAKMAPKQASKFVEMRRSLKEFEKLQESWQAEKAELLKKAKTEDDSKVYEALRNDNETLKKQLSELEDHLSIARIEETPSYKRTVSEPLGKIEEAVKALATKYELKPRDLLDAVRDNDADALNNLSDPLNSMERLRLLQWADQHSKLVASGEELRQNARQKGQSISEQQAKEMEESTRQNVELYRNSAREHWKKAVSEFPFLGNKYQNPDTPEKQAWNAHQDRAVADIETSDPLKMEGHDLGKMLVAERVGEMLKSALRYKDTIIEGKDAKLKEANDTIASLNARLDKINGTQPDAAGNSTVRVPDAPEEDFTMGTEPRMRKLFGK